MTDLPPLIIEVRVNEWTMRNPNQNIPYSPEEIGIDAGACVRAGAALIHYHPRHVVTGERSMDLALYRDAIQFIKEESDAVVMPTLGMDSLPPVQRVGNLLAMKRAGDVMPELVPIDVITCNMDRYLEPERRFTTLADPIYENTPASWQALATTINELGLKPVALLWDVGSVRGTQALVEMGLLKPPVFCEIALTEGGLLCGHPGTIEGLQAHLAFFPRHRDWLWTVMLWGANLLPVAAAAIALGGHVSIGLGDYHYRELGLPTNAALVERVRRIAEAIGRPVATPTQARRMLGIR